MLPEPMAKRACAGSPASDGADDDRLSALPDRLLHTILSFLPARQLVQTSVLSRRWIDLWCSTPCINIDEREFEIGSGRNVSAKKWGKFENFTTNLLLFHSNAVSLDKFRLYAHEHNHRDVDKWIRRGIKYCPAMLDISVLNSDVAFKLPPLGSSFGTLKRLHLYYVSLDNCFAELLSSGSSALEDLELKSCWNYFWDITSPTLKNLFIGCCIHHDAHPLVITAPGLTSLNLHIAHTCYADGISVYETASLVKASVIIQSPEFFPKKNQRKLLSSLFNVTTLKLGRFETAALLIEESGEFPKFANLQTLLLGKCFLDKYGVDLQLRVLGSFIQNAPCLEKLTLWCCMALFVEESGEFPKFANLQTLLLGECFLDKYGVDLQLKVLGSFIQNAPCLEKLTLWCCMFDENPEMEWDSKRKSINLQRHNRKALQCQKLKVVEVIYENDHNHRLVDLLWGITRRLPDASIKLTKI